MIIDDIFKRSLNLFYRYKSAVLKADSRRKRICKLCEIDDANFDERIGAGRKKMVRVSCDKVRLRKDVREEN